jgi:hypothetical protein
MGADALISRDDRPRAVIRFGGIASRRHVAVQRHAARERHARASQQPKGSGSRHCFGAPADSEFRKNALDVRFHRLGRDLQGPSDALVGEALTDHSQDIAFPCGQRIAHAAAGPVRRTAHTAGIPSRNQASHERQDLAIHRPRRCCSGVGPFQELARSRPSLQEDLRWPRKIGQVSKLGSPLRRTDPDDGQAEAVCAGIQGESCS